MHFSVSKGSWFAPYTQPIKDYCHHLENKGVGEEEKIFTSKETAEA